MGAVRVSLSMVLITSTLVVTPAIGQDSARVSVTIEGRVISKLSGRGVDAALVRLDSAAGHVRVDRTGIFRFVAALEPGKHSLVVLRVGYQRMTQYFTVSDSGSIRVPDIALDEQAVGVIRDYAPTCKPIQRKPKRVPRGYWVSAEPDSTARNKYVLCHAGPR